MRTINGVGLKLIEGFEGLELKAYYDAVRIPTVGYGHVIHPQDKLKVGDMITEEQAKQFLRDDLAVAEAGVENAIQVPLNDNQFAACVSLAFNIGVTAFARSTVAHEINLSNWTIAAAHFLDWRFAGHH